MSRLNNPPGWWRDFFAQPGFDVRDLPLGQQPAWAEHHVEPGVPRDPNGQDADEMTRKLVELAKEISQEIKDGRHEAREGRQEARQQAQATLAKIEEVSATLGRVNATLDRIDRSLDWFDDKMDKASKRADDLMAGATPTPRSVVHVDAGQLDEEKLLHPHGSSRQKAFGCLSTEEHGITWARVVDLPGCTAQGRTHDLALRAATLAAEEWVLRERAAGRAVPEPRDVGELFGNPEIMRARYAGAFLWYVRVDPDRPRAALPKPS